MNLIRKRIKELYDENAVHRKGFKIRNSTTRLAASNLAEEAGELLVQLEIGNSATVLQELADVVAVVEHLKELLLVSDEEAAMMAIDKINLRYNSGPYRSKEAPSYPPMDVLDNRERSYSLKTGSEGEASLDG